MADVTEILCQLEAGDASAANELLPLVYSELQRLARAKLSRERVGQTLQATDLVHEAYMRLVKDAACRWDTRGHFFSAAAEAMRRILIERARQRMSLKHGGALDRVQLRDEFFAGDASPDRMLALDEALDRLAAEDPVAAQVVKLKAFAGLSMEQTAQALSLSTPTAYRHWSYARAWLINEIKE
ncbi:MAG: ECF-type sigma factor [Pirellulaceae bacterium]